MAIPASKSSSNPNLQQQVSFFYYFLNYLGSKKIRFFLKLKMIKVKIKKNEDLG